MAASAVQAARCEFEVILEDFVNKAQLTSKQVQDFEATNFNRLRSTIKGIQDEQESKKAMCYMRRLEPFLQTMEQYAKVVDVFVNTSQTLAFVWVRLFRCTSLIPSKEDMLTWVHVWQGPMRWLLIVSYN